MEAKAGSIARLGAATRRWFLLAACSASVTCLLSAQSYPVWFLNPQGLQCRVAVVGYANESFYADSAVSQAKHNALLNARRFQRIHVKGGQAFWGTEAGTYWMGSSIREEFDSTLNLLGFSSAPVAMFATKGFVAVLLGDSACTLDASARSIVTVPEQPPSWTESLPSDGQYHYALGLAPKYYYETSSWEEAERTARLGLARTIATNIRSLQKMSGREGQEIREEQLAVTLHDVHVLARWRDMKQQIFYVLLRMPRL